MDTFNFEVEERPVTSQLFEDAAEYMRKHGWGRGWLQDATGRVCAVGALAMGQGAKYDKICNYSEGDLEWIEGGKLIHLDQDRIRELMDIPCSAIFTWNDLYVDGPQEVLDAFMRAAKTLRDQGL